MIVKDLLESVPNILTFGLPGLSVILLFLTFLLLKSELGKEKPNASMLKTIKFFLVVSVALVIAFLGVSMMGKPETSQKEWVIQGNIELQDMHNNVLHKISKDKCGIPLEKPIPLEHFLQQNLKIIVLPHLPYKSFASNNFSAKIPESLGKEISQVFFEIDGFHCISNNCHMELNSSNYTSKVKMVFVQDTPDAHECSGQ